MASIAEYFLLRDASAIAAKIPDAGRKEIADALALGRQKGEAAEALWSNGHAAEGLRLAVEALLATLEAAPRYGRAVGGTRAQAQVPANEAAPRPASSDDGAAELTGTAADVGPGARAAATDGDVAATPDWREVLRQRGLAPSRSRAIEEVEQKARSTVLPTFDADVSPAHADLYQDLVRARADVDRALCYAAMSSRELAWTRIARIATATVLALLVVVGLYFVLRTPTAITAEASETFANSPTFQAGNVLDGDPATEWLLGDRTTGWVEARLSPPRHVARVTLVNARNAPHFDRATREYRLEFYAAGRLVRSIDGEFERYERDPQPVSHEVGLDGVDRIRFVVRSYHHLGGGLAELRIEE